MLERNLLSGEGEAPLEDSGGVFALVGATGVGKTTSTAKLAAAFATRHGASNLGLITLDAYRVAAHEQLRAYGRILGVPVHTAHDRASLEDLLELLSAKKMVLIDTAGMAQRDARTRELLDMLSHRSVNRLLVVNAAAQGETIEDVLLAYRASSCRGVILSKMDEAVKLGPALDAMIRHKLKVLAVANGQRVPEDWHRLSAQALVHRALRSAPATAWRMDAGDVNLVFAGLRAAPAARRACLTPRPLARMRRHPSFPPGRPGARPAAPVCRHAAAAHRAGGQPACRLRRRGAGAADHGARRDGPEHAGGRRRRQLAAAAGAGGAGPARRHRAAVGAGVVPGGARAAAAPCGHARLVGALSSTGCRPPRRRPACCWCMPAPATWRGCMHGRALRPLLLAADQPDSLTHAYAAMKLLVMRRALMSYDLLLAAPPANRRVPAIAQRLASCAESFLGAALHDWVAIDPACDVRESPSAALCALVAAQLRLDADAQAAGRRRHAATRLAPEPRPRPREP